ncbi:MAG TPA: tetraacyldisaccharide 4'-kinase, partial [Candidatus Saccharimonadales bacterium]|nr:tetraacyldisaccharide 4'-kinase [Candidatus Saccharimonadales bacterium]
WESLAAARAWAYRTGFFKQRKLQGAVISIGNITFGGTGKTPLTIWLAKKLSGRGYRVAILTRGYSRQTRDHRVLLAGADHSARRAASKSLDDGDETQLYLRHLPSTHVGIAAHRFDAGHLLERKVPIDVHLLDDGFQHLALARDCDVVLIDASNPWGSNSAAGRLLRESPSALRRAHVLILTRCEQVDVSSISRLENTLRQINPNALLLNAATVLSGYRSDLNAPPLGVRNMEGKRALGLCAIGNADNFWALLRAAGVTLVDTRTYPDHHHYNDQEVDQINDLLRSHSADCLITTEKDVVNLPHPERFAGNFIVPAYWAEIDLSISCEEEFLELLEQKIGLRRKLSERH